MVCSAAALSRQSSAHWTSASLTGRIIEASAGWWRTTCCRREQLLSGESIFLRSNSFLNYNSLGVDPGWRRHRQTARHGTAWHTAFYCMLRVAIGGHTSLHYTGPSTVARDVAAQPFAWLARANPP